MLKKLITVTVLGVVGTTGLLAGGCMSNGGNEKPYGLTGNVSEQRQNELKYTDQKGRYRTDLEMTKNAQR
jgi:hypothetical protein